MLPAVFKSLLRAKSRNRFAPVQTPGAVMWSLYALLGRLMAEVKGIALVETALVTPFLAIVIIGTVDTARYGAAKMKIQQAINRGLEMSSMGGTGVSASNIQSEAASQANVSTSAVTVTQTLECGGTATTWTTSTTPCASGETARYTRIQISTTFAPSFAMGMLARTLGNSNGLVPISATGVLRIE